MCSTTSIGNKTGSTMTTQTQKGGQSGQWVGGVFIPNTTNTGGGGNTIGNTTIPNNTPPTSGGNQIGNLYVPATPGEAASSMPPQQTPAAPGINPLQAAMNAAQAKLDQWEAAGGNALRGLQLADTQATGIPDLKNYIGFLIPKRGKTS
jgi:hypothetical protein